MVNVIINKDGKEKSSMQGDCIIAFSISDMAEDSSEASCQIAAEGDIHPLYFYYLGYEFINFIKESTKMEGAPSVGVLFDLFSDGLKDGIDKMLFGGFENDYKEV